MICKVCGTENDQHATHMHAIADRLAKLESIPLIAGYFNAVARYADEVPLASAEGRPVCTEPDCFSPRCNCNQREAAKASPAPKPEAPAGRCCRARCRCRTRIDDDVRCEACAEAGCLTSIGDRCEVPLPAEPPSGPAKASLAFRVRTCNGIGLKSLSDDVADLEARLAAAEKERDEAQAFSSPNCTGHDDEKDCICTTEGRKCAFHHPAEIMCREAVLAERARVNGWWMKYLRRQVSRETVGEGIASGSPAPGGGK